MANVRKLDNVQEHELAKLVYLGINKEILAKKFQVSEATVYKISKRLEGKVVEEMKGAVTQTKTPFERGLEYLVNKLKNNEYVIFDEDLSEPLVEESLEKIKFKDCMKPTSSYDNLTRAIFGELSFENGVGTFGLFGDYLLNLDFRKKINKNKLIDEFSQNLTQRLRKGFFAIEESVLKKKVFEEVLNTLSEREAEVIRLYFGINCERLDLEKIKEKFYLSRERVRQIKEKAIRRLRHASRSNSLKYLYGHSDKEVQNYLTQLEIEEKVRERVQEELQKRYREQIEGKTSVKDKYKNLLEINVDELELSTRAHNCLRIARIKTLGELVKLNEFDLLKFRGFGRKSLAEIAELLSKYGLSFKN